MAVDVLVWRPLAVLPGCCRGASGGWEVLMEVRAAQLRITTPDVGVIAIGDAAGPLVRILLPTVAEQDRAEALRRLRELAQIATDAADRLDGLEPIGEDTL